MWRDAMTDKLEERKRKQSVWSKAIFVSSSAERGAATGITTLVSGSTNQNTGSDSGLIFFRGMITGR